jgi:hypothetical protein
VVSWCGPGLGKGLLGFATLWGFDAGDAARTENQQWIHAKDFMYSMTNLSFGIVTEQSRGGTMKVNEIFQGTGYVRIRLHCKDSC